MNLPFSLSFTSFGYLFCLGILLLLTRVLPGRFRPLLLFLASVCYYGALAPSGLWVLLLTALLIYALGLWFERGKAASETRESVGRGTVLSLGILLLLLSLFLFKYLPSLLSAFTASVSSLAAPLGISYFTFSGIAYLADVKKKKIPAQKSFLFLSLYLLYFPRIASGPIQRPGEFFEQIEGITAPASPSGEAERLRAGGLLLLSGFLKKLALSDLLSAAVSAVYGDPEGKSGFAVLFATVLYAWQLYGDFSGYTDIARGSSLLLGIDLPENFRRPYAATSIRDFWRRWHISLSSFLRDYVYIPLGGSRQGKAKKCRNLLVTFLVSGLWHGVGVTYLLWGLWHGLLQILEDLTDPLRKKLLSRTPRGENGLPYRITATVLTFLLVCFGWLLFRAESLSDVGVLLSSFADMGSPAAALFLLFDDPLLPLTAFLSLPLSGYLEKCAANGRKIPFSLLFLLLFAALFLLLTSLASDTGGGSFIYVNF